jgi:uncharacterized protein DUF6600
MKRIFLAVTMLVLLLPALKQAEAGAEISIDFFYDNVGSDGSWVEVADYGYCWQPNVAVSNSKWRPYSDGYWVYTDVGWTWISNEDFGWATYHYGRWTRLRDRGWFWVPGREWGPAWVSWRTGGDYVGWAPLPPRGRGDVDYDNRPISGQVDVEFDIGPSYYNFIEVRYIGEPVLRERIFEPSLNVTYITKTVNVTNISYTNSVVYNYGPDYNTLNRYSARPIRRMSLERESNVDLSVAVKSNGLLRVQGDKLVVAAPPLLQKPAKPIAPKTVKEKIAKPTFERGWDGADPKAQAEMKEKMTKEDPKAVASPSFSPNPNAAAGGSPMPATAASPVASANPAATAAPASPAMAPDKGKGKDKRLENASPMPTAAAPAIPGSSPATTPPGKSKKDRGEKPAPAMTPSSSTAADTSPAPTPKRPSDRKVKSPSSPAPFPDGTPEREAPMREKDLKKDKRTEKAPDTMPPTRQPSDTPADKVKRDKHTEKAPDTMPPTHQPSDAPAEKAPRKPKSEPPSAPPNREAPPDSAAKRPQPPERAAPPSGPATNAPVKTEEPRKKGPDKKTTEPAPSPGG